MVRKLPLTDEGREYVQYRGRETTAIIDRAGVVFETVHKEAWNQVVHKPLPVYDPEELGEDDDPPENGIRRELAEELTRRNPVVCWGVVCEYPTDDGIDGGVYPTPEAADGATGQYGDNGDEE